MHFVHVLYCLYVYAVHKCIYVSFLSELFLSPCHLSHSCTISLSFTHNCLWGVLSEYQYAAVSLETVRTERQAVCSKGRCCYQINSLLIHVCTITEKLSDGWFWSPSFLQKLLAGWDFLLGCLERSCVFPGTCLWAEMGGCQQLYLIIAKPCSRVLGSTHKLPVRYHGLGALVNDMAACC